MKLNEIRFDIGPVLVVGKPQPRYQYDSEKKVATQDIKGWRVPVFNDEIDEPLQVNVDGDLPKFVKSFAKVQPINMRASYVDSRNEVFAKADGFKTVEGEK